MFNKNVTNVLSQVGKITNSVILKHPVTVASSPVGDIMINFNVASLDADEFEDTGIYNLAEFLNTFKLFGDDRTVSLTDKIFHIADGATKVEYISNSLALLSEYDKSISVFETTASVPTVASFNLSLTDAKKIKQASGIFADLEDLTITSQDDEIIISLSASNKFNAKSNKFSINKEAETTKEFSIAVPVENFNSLPASEYTVLVKYNSAKNSYRIMMKSTEISDFTVLMTIKK